MDTMRRVNAPGPHDRQPVVERGAPLADARGALVLVHGRGDSAEGMLGLAHRLPVDGLVLLAPQAAGHSWYPNRFLAPLASNEPWLSSALAALDDLVRLCGEAGLGPERIVLAGFSQGACLALEYAVRQPRRYGGLAGLSGGLIGPPGTRWTPAASFARTPVFLGCSDVDGHIPAGRVRESAAVFRDAGADVTDVLYPGMDHAVTDEELPHVRAMLDRLPGRAVP
jgi:predicted esterase